jgi:hypothetical protein
MTVMMCLYQCMSMDVTYNFRQPKNPMLIGTFFKDYVRDNNGYSEEEDKQLIMNLGDVLLAVDGVDIAEKSLKDIRCLILYKHQQMVQLTFLNENWFNKFDRYSVRVDDEKLKNRYA